MKLKFFTRFIALSILLISGVVLPTSVVNQTQQELCVRETKDNRFLTIKPGFCYQDKSSHPIVISSNLHCSGGQYTQSMNDDNTYCIVDTTPTLKQCTALCGQNNLPPGDYSQNCRSCRLKSSKILGPDDTLECHCDYYDQSGTPRNRKTELKLDATKSDLPVSNCGGHLFYGTCQPLPSGSYQQSCSACFVKEDNTLDCTYCQYVEKGKGKNKSTSLALQTGSQEDISNCSGNLKYGSC